MSSPHVEGRNKVKNKINNRKCALCLCAGQKTWIWLLHSFSSMRKLPFDSKSIESGVLFSCSCGWDLIALSLHWPPPKHCALFILSSLSPPPKPFALPYIHYRLTLTQKHSHTVTQRSVFRALLFLTWTLARLLRQQRQLVWCLIHHEGKHFESKLAVFVCECVCARVCV